MQVSQHASTTGLAVQKHQRHKAAEHALCGGEGK